MRHDISELALLQEKGAQAEVTDRKTKLAKVEKLASDIQYNTVNTNKIYITCAQKQPLFT